MKSDGIVMGQIVVARRSITAGFISGCNKPKISDIARHCAGYFSLKAGVIVFW